MIFLKCSAFASKLDLMVHHHDNDRVLLMKITVMQKDWFAVFMVAVTLTVWFHSWKKLCSSHISKLLLLLYYVWLYIYQLSSQIGVSSRSIGLLSSKSRSQQGFRLSGNTLILMSSELVNLWQPNFVQWYITMNHKLCTKFCALKGQGHSKS